MDTIDAQRWTMDKTSQHRGRGGSNQKKLGGRRNHIIRRNIKKPDKRTRSLKEIEKR